MRIKTVLCVVVSLFLYLQPFCAEAGEVVMAEGMAAVISGNTVIARDKALDDALRKAVEQTVGTLVSSDTMTENFKVIHDKILAQTTGYIERYKVLSEGREGDVFKVKIQAEVGMANLTDDLRALGVLHSMKEKPKVMVIINEKNAGVFGTTGSEEGGQAESTIIEKLLNAGFNVVDPQTVKANITREKALRLLEGDPRAAAAAGLQYGAQVVITGKAISKNAGAKLYGTQMQSIQATLQARVITTDNARIIASRSEQGRQAHIDEVQGGALAIKEAGERLADLLISDILSQWKKEVYGRSQEISLVITGLSSYNSLSAIKHYLQKETQGVKALNQRSFTGGIAELMLDYGGKATNLADELSTRKFKGFRLEPTNVTPNRIDLKAIFKK